MARSPRVDVPTQEEFDALVERVTHLEEVTEDQELRISELEGDVEEPEPPGEGVQAKLVCDALGVFGVNTFSSLDPDANLWGSWPADYSPPSVIHALDFLTWGTGHSFRIREYHYASRAQMQIDWIEDIQASLPQTRFSMCVGANGSVDDAASLSKFQDAVNWLEGLNEPNTDFGSGQVPFATTVSIQQALQSSRLPLMGPSIVAGMPHPEGWIEKYCGTPENLTFLNSLMSIGNGHFYPPDHPDAAGTSLAEYVGGLCTAYTNNPIALTEYHPSLFNGHGRAPGQEGWDGERDAYYTLCALFRAAKCSVNGLWWYALFDYGSTYVCGLFPQGHANNPRPAATALRNLYRICADTGADNRTFAPGRLDLVVTAPPEVGWDLYQASDGRFFIAIWHSQREPGGEGVPISIRLHAAPSGLRIHDLVTNTGHSETPPPTDITLELCGRAVIVEITP